MIRTMTELEAALDAHSAAKWRAAVAAAIQAGNADDAIAFAKRAIRDERQRQADTRTFGDEPATLADMADGCKLPSHGDTRNETIVREHKNGGYHSYTQCEKYCAQCGWLTLRGIFGGLAWVAEHEGHESKRNQLPLAA